MVFADPSQTVAEWALLGHSVSGVRMGFELSSLRSSCSAACQNSSSRPSGLPACSHSRCARSLMACSVGSGIASPAVKHGPTLGGMGGLGAGPCRPAIGGDAGPGIQALIWRESSNQLGKVRSGFPKGPLVKSTRPCAREPATRGGGCVTSIEGCLRYQPAGDRRKTKQNQRS
jgi:hypothetical protein